MVDRRQNVYFSVQSERCRFILQILLFIDLERDHVPSLLVSYSLHHSKTSLAYLQSDLEITHAEHLFPCWESLLELLLKSLRVCVLIFMYQLSQFLVKLILACLVSFDVCKECFSFLIGLPQL